MAKALEARLARLEAWRGGHRTSAPTHRRFIDDPGGADVYAQEYPEAFVI
jgi:hypothetical protein